MCRRASLAHKGLLGPVKKIWRLCGDLSSVPAEHMASLISCLTGWVSKSVKSQQLHICREQSLGSEDTEALVGAEDKSHVEEVWLLNMTLDIEALTKFSGHG